MGYGLGGGALGYLTGHVTGQRPSSAAPPQHPIYTALQNLQPTATGAAGGGAGASAGGGAGAVRETSAQYGAGRETRALTDSSLIIQSAEIAPAPKWSKFGARATSTSTSGTRISARITHSAAAPAAAPAAAAPPSPKQEERLEERLEERVLGVETENDAGAASAEGGSEALIEVLTPAPEQDDAENPES